MKTIIIKSLNELFNKEPLALMLGNFDGFHKGHQQLLKVLKEKDIKKGLLTFYPHPLKVLNNFDFKYLDTIKDKEIYLENDIDYLVVLSTSKELLNSTKNDFIKFLKLNNVRDIVCGNDFTFGSHKSGTIKDLSLFNLSVVPDYTTNNIRISSTKIREFLRNGNVVEAKNFLGRYYELQGLVVHGSQIGRTIGFPTANIEENEYLLPKNGVYFGYAIIDKEKYFGMINIGVNPTINLIDKRRLEINIFDFSKDIYGKTIRVGFIDKIRDEKKFDSKEELVKTLELNRDTCIKLAKSICQNK